jgi:predicted TIM-barrel fold metal-dependent hydrolase
MLLTNYRPRSALVTKSTIVDHPRFPVIDAHNHLSGFAGSWDQRPVSAVLDALDTAGVHTYVDLDGMWNEGQFHSHLDHFKNAAPDRFRIFTGLDWPAWPEHADHFGDWAAERLRQHVASGADGLKVWKDLGLRVHDQHGALVPVDDARLDPVWAVAGELGIPVMIHTADPVAFFWPLDENNERWEELGAHPDWHFPSPPFPSFESIVNAFANVVMRHSQTNFIGAHVSSYAENLAWVSDLMDKCPNFNVDISARISELGRQPYTARRFFLEHADRILFGTDAGPDLDTYRTYYRFLETEDEYFDYGSGEIPGQGRWRIYGLHLPDSVLQQVYSENARRLITQRATRTRS